MHDPLEVLVVEPHRGMRTSLCNVLSLEDDFHVAARSADMLSAVRDASRTAADVAIVDDRLTALGPPAEAIGTLAKRLPVVIIGMGEPGLYTRPYLDAGAAGYWCKTGDFGELTQLLRDIATGHRRAA
jgi:two-component system response regulator EvgA